METLIINIPNKKLALVKQVLQGLGIDINESSMLFSKVDYQKKISQTSVWSELDIKNLESGKDAFNNLKIEQW